METGRAIFSSLLKGERSRRPAFIPLMGDLAARIGGFSSEAWNSDPTLWANGLVKTAQMLDLDGIVVGFDLTILAEACGCRVKWIDDKPVLSLAPEPLQQAPEERGRMKSCLEAAKRVFQVCRKEMVCVASLVGPATLAGQIFGSTEGSARAGDVKEPLVRAAEAFCRTAPDLLIFMENLTSAINLGPALGRMYATLKNITSYYNVASGLYVEGYDPDTVDRYAIANTDLWILGPGLDGRRPCLDRAVAGGSEFLAVGAGLPLDQPGQASEMIDEGLSAYRAERKSPGFFFTSLGPVNRQTDLETFRALIRKISQIVL